jgi:hypothetical protein
MKKLVSRSLVLTFAAFTIWGCQKSLTDTSVTTATMSNQDSVAVVASAEGESDADLIFDGVFDNVLGVNEEVGIGTGIGVFEKKFINGKEDSTGNKCFTVTITPLQKDSFPKTVTIDFGTGCKGPDGKIRKGKIITQYTGPLSVPGKKSYTTFNDFFVDSVQVKGTFTVENTSTSNNRSFTTTLVGGRLVYSTTRFIEWSFTRKLVQTEGNGTPNYPKDDIYKITGSSKATLVNGASIFRWTAEVTEPLIKKYTCKYISKGIVRIIYNNTIKVDLNYGSGDCDNKATLTINGVTVQIKLN